MQTIRCTLYCWGHNQYGQLADPTFFHRRYVSDSPPVLQSISVASIGKLLQFHSFVNVRITHIRVRSYLCDSISRQLQRSKRPVVLRRLTLTQHIPSILFKHRKVFWCKSSPACRSQQRRSSCIRHVGIVFSIFANQFWTCGRAVMGAVLCH